jgi:hypothetical protein
MRTVLLPPGGYLIAVNKYIIIIIIIRLVDFSDETTRGRRYNAEALVIFKTTTGELEDGK